MLLKKLLMTGDDAVFRSGLIEQPNVTLSKVGNYPIIGIKKVEKTDRQHPDGTITVPSVRTLFIQTLTASHLLPHRQGLTESGNSQPLVPSLQRH